MKPTQIAFLGIAVVAGGAAFILSGSKPPETPQAVTISAAPQLETEEVLTAGRDLPMGTVINDPDLLWQLWPRAGVGPGMIKKTDDARLIADLKGSVVRGSFVQGEPLRRDKLVKGPNASFMSTLLPSGSRAVAINIDSQGATTAGGFILPNDRVDIIRTYRDEDAAKSGVGDAYVSETILPNIRVLAIGPTIQEKNGERVSGTNATLEVTPQQAETIVLAQRVGQLSLALRSLLDFTKKEEPNAGDDKADKSLSVIRYGVQNSLAKR